MTKKRRRGRRKKGSWFSRLSVGKKIVVCLGGVFIALAASGVIYVAAKLGKIETEEIPQEDIIINEEVEDLGEGFTTIALFGVDSREGGLGKGTRTDCIIVASLNNKTKEIKMVSVYRDTLLDLSEGTLQKCNAAYSYGGPTQAINMLNMNLDLDIQKYVTVDFGVVSEVIDLLGGVEIDLKQEEIQYLNQYLEETAAVAGKEAHFVSEPGVQVLDGPQATTYARIRSTAGGDFTRTERQRLVIEKMVEKIKESNLATINNIINKIFPTISTNFSAAEILSYAKHFSKYTLGENTGFPMDKTTATISGLGSIVIPVNLDNNVQQLHEFLYGNSAYIPSSKVCSISAAIVKRVGERQATDDAALKSQTYTQDSEEVEQGNNKTTGGTNSGTGNTATGGENGSSTGGGIETGGGAESGGGTESGGGSEADNETGEDSDGSGDI